MPRDLVFVRSNNIIFGNTQLDLDKVQKIKKNFDSDKYFAPCGFPTGKGVIITDGNHRVKALVEMGETYIPIAPLTKREYDYIKFSKRTVDLLISIPDRLLVVK